jgi:hypothetical protein
MTAAAHPANDPTAIPGSESTAHHYAVFGGVLRSELPFPDLADATDASADWVFRIAHEPVPAVRAELLGERQLGLEHYRLSRLTETGVLRLEYSHAGVFEISPSGREITWYRRDDAVLELVRAIVLGPALGLALEMAGFLCLHASAVAIDDRVVAFVGPKYHGKSTLATALTAAGARLVGDDLLVVAVGPPVMVRPGVASVRLFEDAADALPVSDLCGRVIPGVKRTATGFANDSLMRSEAPLDAIYLLQPQRPTEDQRAGWRTQLSPGAATITLAQQAKVGDSLVGLSAAGARLRDAAAVASRVPVWTLHAVRDLGRLAQLAEQIMDWTRHDAEVGTTGSRGQTS